MRAKEIFGSVPGLRFTLEKGNGEGWSIIAYIGDDYVGSMSIGPSRTGYGYSVMDVSVNPEYRRKGIATAMYDFAYKNGFAPLTPDNKQSADGKAFWARAHSKKWRLGQPRPQHEWGKLRGLRKPRHGPPQ